MNILVINGDCIETNTSANLCHLAYLRGLVEAGHQVTLLSADGRDYVLDPAMKIPAQVRQYRRYGVSFYEKLSLKKRAAAGAEVHGGGGSESPSLAGRAVAAAKKLVLSMYGVHGIYATFVRKAKDFRLEETFDVVISDSTPVTSHLLAHKLIKSGNIKTKKWIQIWEDPWYSDAYGFNSKKAIYREEKRLLSYAQHICYVSPLTLENQKRLYPESAHKMYWQPLPYYYKGEAQRPHTGPNRYGYFGDYVPEARNLEPFYRAAEAEGVRVNICGNPSNLFPSTEHITIHPRLPLNKLKPIEDSTNVLIFLCNRKGGQIPGKIYQYSATTKTVLFIMDGTPWEQQVLRDFFGPLNRYVFCENTVDSIRQAIRRIESGDLGPVKNEPLERFAPTKTIENILNCGETT